MTRYPVQYISGSKKAALNIESMSTPHLANAWRKLRQVMHETSIVQAGSPAAESRALAIQPLPYMEQELRARGCAYDQETDQWTFPEVAP